MIIKFGLAASADGKFVAMTTGTDNATQVLAFPSMHCVCECKTVQFPCSVAFGPENSIFICDSVDNNIVEIDFLTGRQLRHITSDYLSHFDISCNGKCVAVSQQNDSIALFEYASGVCFKYLRSEFKCPKGTYFSLSGDCLWVADWGNNRVVKVKLSSGNVQNSITVRRPHAVVECDGREVAIACEEQVLIIDEEGAVTVLPYKYTRMLCYVKGFGILFQHCNCKELVKVPFWRCSLRAHFLQSCQ